jgi:N-acetylmuramic acid 6-phosphate etherase
LRSNSNLSSNLRRLRTEQSNDAAQDLDCKSSLEIARLINAEDATLAATVAHALPQIARAIDLVAAALRGGGRLIYVGAGTSGRIAALDAAECPPTFNIDRVQFIIAGGPKALASDSEISEDDSRQGREEMARRNPGKHDVIIGIASSGRTPFTLAAVELAHHCGARTIALTCNPGSPLERAAHFAIVTPVGPEVLAGSSRMKAATAHKMVLNMISTGAMSRLGYVYGNLMVNVAGFWSRWPRSPPRSGGFRRSDSRGSRDVGCQSSSRPGRRRP